MLTDAEIRAGYAEHFGREMSDSDLSTFKRFMLIFDCTDADTFEDAHEKVGISLRMLNAK